MNEKINDSELNSTKDFIKNKIIYTVSYTHLTLPTKCWV